MSLTGFYPYIHDLSEPLNSLAELGFRIDEEVLIASEVSIPHYTLSQYPGRRSIRYTRSRAGRCLLSAKQIIERVKRAAET